MKLIFKNWLPAGLAFGIAISVFLKNAWVSEDAYILFRSIEQLFAGNGPIWNPHERVQVFTSPLWFWILSAARVFSRDVFLNAIVVSFVLWVATLVVLKRVFKSNVLLLVAVLLLAASTGFYDYTSSGLENVAAYFLIAIYFENYIRLFDCDGKTPEKRILGVILVSFGLMICVRHDLVVLLLPSTVYAVAENRRVFTVKSWILLGSAALLPFILWSFFSLIYYGFPFPNTAYAKLGAGIPRSTAFILGSNFFISSLLNDFATLLVIAGGLLSALYGSGGKKFGYLGCGVLLNVLYVFYIGGDFMQGRFLSYSYLVCVLVSVSQLAGWESIKVRSTVVILLCFYLVLYPHTPFNSPLTYTNKAIERGIADERGYYFNELSLFRYVLRKTDTIFPDHGWADEGLQFKASPYGITVGRAIGLFGYWSGTQKIIVDSMALSDPLLARLPSETHELRPGHFPRIIPAGYVESLVYPGKDITDPRIRAFNEKLKIITRSKDLFTMERMKTVLLFNLGAYNHLAAK